MNDTNILVFATKYAPGPKSDAPPVPAAHVPLSVALTCTPPSDAHAVGYCVPGLPQRLDVQLFRDKERAHEIPAGGVPMVMASFDFDDEVAHTAKIPARPEWRQEQRPKVDALLAAHPGLVAFDTRGGMRAVGVLATPYVLRSEDDAVAWAALYKSWGRYLARAFGLIADMKCADWTHLFRLPRVMRDGVQQSPEMRGSLGTWNPELTEDDRVLPIASALPLSVGAYVPSEDDDEDDVAEQVRRFKTEPLHLRGEPGTESDFLFLIQNYGPGLNVSRATTLANLLEHYDSRLPDGHKWTDWSELNHKLDEAYAGALEKGSAPGQMKEAIQLLAKMKEGSAVRIDKEVREALGVAPAVAGPVRQVTNEPVNVDTAKVAFDKVALFLGHSEKWDGVFRFNVMSRKKVAVNPPFPMRLEHGPLSNGDLGKLRIVLAQAGMNVAADTIKMAVSTICEDRSYNPFSEFLDSLPKVTQGEPLALDTVHETIFRTSNPLHSVMFTKTLVAAVRRGRAVPGIGQAPRPVDHQGVLTLIGKQDKNKGRFLKMLGGQFYHSMTGDLEDKDTTIKAQGHVIVELEELTTASRAERTKLKSFLSQDLDNERASYEEGSEKVPRSYVMIATSNEPDLEDPTGNRRFWCLQLTEEGIDIEAATALRDRLWAEADMLASTSYEHHLTAEEKRQVGMLAETHEVSDSTRDKILVAFQGKELGGRDFVTMNDVYAAIKVDASIVSRGDERTVSGALRKLGCSPRQLSNTARTRGWKVPKELVELAAEVKIEKRHGMAAV